MKERTLMKKRFARMYPNNKPLTDKEADMLIRIVKKEGKWEELLEEERQWHLRD